MHPQTAPHAPPAVHIHRQYRISGYTREPHGYATETVDAGAWQSYRAGVGANPLREVVDWVLYDPVDFP